MNEKLVLPRFDLPKDGPHAAIRALWATGCLVVVATLVLGLAMWRHRSLEEAVIAEKAARVAAARRAAEAPPPAPVAKAALAVDHHALAVKDPAKDPAASMPDAGHDDAAQGVVASRHRSHHHSAGKSAARSKTLAKVSGDKISGEKTSGDKSSKKASAANDDTIDRLLKQYK
jgi:hypothetical protein